jgi:hypothetical protein
MGGVQLHPAAAARSELMRSSFTEMQEPQPYVKDDWEFVIPQTTRT